MEEKKNDRSEKWADIWGVHGYFWRCGNVRDKRTAGDGCGKFRRRDGCE